jgi:hypothetical protein
VRFNARRGADERTYDGTSRDETSRPSRDGTSGRHGEYCPSRGS